MFCVGGRRESAPLGRTNFRENAVATNVSEELIDAAAQAHIDGLETKEQLALKFEFKDMKVNEQN